jgi:hypothetical protein
MVNCEITLNLETNILGFRLLVFFGCFVWWLVE